MIKIAMKVLGRRRDELVNLTLLVKYEFDQGTTLIVIITPVSSTYFTVVTFLFD